MRFKQFEVRPTQPVQDDKGRLQYEVVKWHPSQEYCWVIGFLTRDHREDWDFRSVGMRYFRDREEGLEKYIMSYCDLVDSCIEDEEP